MGTLHVKNGNKLRVATYGRGIWEIPLGPSGGPCDNLAHSVSGLIPDMTEIRTSEYILSNGILISPRSSYFQAEKYIQMFSGFEVQKGASLVVHSKDYAN